MLVEQCINGNMTAYRLLYERYAKAMYNTALRITNQAADAEDVLQESFTDAFTSLKTFENRSSFGAWLKQIVIFKSIALLKKRRISFIDLDAHTGEMMAEEPGEESPIEFTVAGIKASISDLPDGYRTVLSLYLLEGYDQEEIAGILKVAPSTVRTQYIRGKEKLLQLLKKEVRYE